ncbi:MAG: class I adenylate-forming enzyme family protein, partial [Pseudomonadota bacterium]
MMEARYATYDMSPLSSLVGAAHSTIPAIWAARAERSNDSQFLKWRGRRWTYGEAWKEIRQVAAALLGVSIYEDRQLRIASFMPNRPEALWVWFGASAAGACYTALNPDYRGPLLEKMLDLIEPDVLFVDANLVSRLQRLGRSGGGGRIIAVGAQSDSAVAQVPPPQIERFESFTLVDPLVQLPPVRPSDTAGIMLTSGT